MTPTRAASIDRILRRDRAITSSGIVVLAGLAYAYIGSHPEGIIDGEHEGDVLTTIAQFGNQPVDFFQPRLGIRKEQD